MHTVVTGQELQVTFTNITDQSGRQTCDCSLRVCQTVDLLGFSHKTFSGVQVRVVRKTSSEQLSSVDGNKLVDEGGQKRTAATRITALYYDGEQ